MVRRTDFSLRLRIRLLELAAGRVQAVEDDGEGAGARVAVDAGVFERPRGAEAIRAVGTMLSGLNVVQDSGDDLHDGGAGSYLQRCAATQERFDGLLIPQHLGEFIGVLAVGVIGACC